MWKTSVAKNTYDTENARMLGHKTIMMWGCGAISHHTEPHQPNDLEIWRSEDTRKHTQIWTYEDERTQVWKETQVNLKIWGSKDTNKQVWTWSYEDVRMQGHKKTHTNLGIWHKDKRMWGYNHIHRNLSIWGYEDSRMQGCKQAWMNLRI